MSSELKLSLENFQSISQGELVFQKGLNFIIGQSNSGKSATFRALKACLSNPSGSQRFIKKGTRRASVKLEYEGNEIVWNRTSKESSYTINGEEYIKTGNSSAFKILDNTGFARDENDTIMNIEEELQLPFPFGLSKTDLFKLYENVFCISDSATILKSAKEQEEGLKGEISSLEVEVNKCSLKLEELQKFVNEVSIDTLKQYKSKLVGAQNKLTNLNKDLPFIKKVSTIVQQPVPLIITFENKLVIYNDKLSIKGAAQKIYKYHKLLKSLPENLEVTSKLDQYSDLVNLKSVISKIGHLKDPQITTFSDKSLKYNELLECQKNYNLLKGLNINIEEKTFISKLELLEQLKSYKRSLSSIINQGKLLQTKYKEKIKELKELQVQLSKFDVCPLCHKPLEKGEHKC